MIIITIIMVMILYFFASYSLYVALCFSVVNKRKAPSHLLSAPRSPAGAALCTAPGCPKPQEANPCQRSWRVVLPKGIKTPKPGADPFS